MSSLTWTVSMLTVLTAKAFRLLLSQTAASDWGWIMWFTPANGPVECVRECFHILYVFMFLFAHSSIHHLVFACNCVWMNVCLCTLTGSNVAEKASCRAQQANLHISSVNTGPTVTRTYLQREEPKYSLEHNSLFYIGVRIPNTNNRLVI